MDTLKEVGRQAAVAFENAKPRQQWWTNDYRDKLADTVTLAVGTELMSDMVTHAAPLSAREGIQWAQAYIARRLALSPPSGAPSIQVGVCRKFTPTDSHPTRCMVCGVHACQHPSQPSVEAAPDVTPTKEPTPAYRVEVETDGCECCNAGKQWTVVGPDDIGSSTSYEDEEDAESFAAALNHAYQAGKLASVTPLCPPAAPGEHNQSTSSPAVPPTGGPKCKSLADCAGPNCDCSVGTDRRPAVPLAPTPPETRSRQVAREVGRKYLAGLAGQDADRIPYRLTPNQQELLEIVADAVAESLSSPSPGAVETPQTLEQARFSLRQRVADYADAVADGKPVEDTWARYCAAEDALITALRSGGSR